jgi:hypothetical protein
MSPTIVKICIKFDVVRTTAEPFLSRALRVPSGGEATEFRYAGLQNVLIPNIVRAVLLLKTPRIVGLPYVLRKGPEKTVRAFRR